MGEEWRPASTSESMKLLQSLADLWTHRILSRLLLILRSARDGCRVSSDLLELLGNLRVEFTEKPFESSVSRETEQILLLT